MYKHWGDGAHFGLIKTNLFGLNMKLFLFQCVILVESNLVTLSIVDLFIECLERVGLLSSSSSAAVQQ